MIDYKSFAEVQQRHGLRLVIVQGLPSPWSQAAKTIFELKQLDHVIAPWRSFEENAEIQAWGGEASAPFVVWNDEKPLHRWIDILQLAERLAPLPALIPSDVTDRALMFGLSHEICGREGIGWNRRLQMVASAYVAGDGSPMTTFGDKYGFNERDAALASARVAASLRALAGQLHGQEKRGRSYFVGDRLSAVDIYWTAFANLFDPLPPDILPIPDAIRPMFVATDPIILDALDPILLRHRDRVFREHFRNPVEM